MLRCFKDTFTESDLCDVNFYFESRYLGVSDNHRMAYWFFARKAKKGSVLVHLDTHPDCSYFREDDRKELTKIEDVKGLEAFVNHRYLSPVVSVCPVAHGNWIPALLDMHPELFDTVYLICHEDCGPIVQKDLPKTKKAKEEVFWRVDGLGAASTCFSIDVDYYYYCAGEGQYCVRDGFPAPVEHFSRCISHVLRCPRALLFVALSPSYCGGWNNVMPFVRIIDKSFGLSLSEQVNERLRKGHVRWP